MHPILSGRETAALYLAAWLIIGGLISALLALPGVFSWVAAAVLALPMALIYAFVCLSSYYLCRAFPLQGSGYGKLFVTLLLAALVSSALWTLAGSGWALTIQSALDDPLLAERYRQQVPLLFGVGVLLYLLVAAVHYVIIAFDQARLAERRTLELRLLTQDAELKLLRAQINPHFLFNCLNSVSALITSDPEGARTMSLKLAGFLRESLRLGEKKFIRLREEAALAGEYLHIEQVRFGKRLQVDVDIPPGAGEILVPSLLLQPIVENAVTHGIAHVLEGGTVRISARTTRSRLFLTVVNPCDDDRPRGKGAGVGLQNARNRLKTIYGRDGQLEVEETNHYFRTTLILPSTA